MKKFRKILAAVCAAAVCAVSMTSFISNAAVSGLYQTVTPYTVSFTSRGVKYSLWQEASDYWKFDEKTMELHSYTIGEDEDEEKVTCYDGGVNVYVSETGRGIYGYYYRYYRYEDGKTYALTEIAPLFFDKYLLENENDKKTLESYLTDNNIPYTDCGKMELHFDEGTIVYYTIEPQFDKGTTTYYDDMNVYMDIKENTGFVCQWGLVEQAVQIADVENALPEKTLDGDANVDGKVDIADAAAIIQHIGNPAKYALTIQGEANADCYNTGDGITGMDAVAIQKLEAGLIESFDEA